MLEILFSDDVPNDTYFRVGDAEPFFRNGDLVLLDGDGSRRSWGRPGVSSTVVYQDAALVAVHVGFHHKHRGSQFWRYFRIIDNQFIQVKWAKLIDDERQLVLTAEKEKAPFWAKSPGKLRVERNKLEKGFGYKLVGIQNEKYFSLFDKKTEYKIGVTLTQEARTRHGGGYYFYKNLDDTRSLKSKQLASGFGRFALLLVEVSGTIIDYGHKYAASSITPVKVIETLGIYEPYGETEENIFSLL